MPHKNKTTKKEPKKKHSKTLKKLNSKSPKVSKLKTSAPKMKRWNETFIGLLAELEALMYLKGEGFRAVAYARAQEAVMLIQEDITSLDQLKGIRGIGKTILSKFKEFMETGKLRTLEKAKGNPLYLFAKIHGIGPKKAREVVEKHKITTLEELEVKKDDVLNDIQKKGLKYFYDIQRRIPREEIKIFEKFIRKEFKKLKASDADFEIVGSYRRGAPTSGDIDIIVTQKNNNKEIFTKFIDALIKKGIIKDVLSKGKIKSMVIAKLPGKPARRVDFMWSPPAEYPFAILYFTGSKAFNVGMRHRAREFGYSMNEHGITHLHNKKPIGIAFKNEKSIFDFLNMVFKTPAERKDGRAIISQGKTTTHTPMVIKTSKPLKNKTLKRKKAPMTKTLIALFKEKGQSFLETLNETQLADMIRVCNDHYYNKKALLTDEEYDILREYMEDKYSTNPVLTEVGAPITKEKVKLPYFLASMDKIKPDTKKLGQWRAKYPGKVVVSAKLDGASGLYTTEGDKPQLFTRGDGAKGQDISYLIPYLKLPKGKDLVIRGELIIPTARFNEKYSNKYANPRSATIGIINGKDFTPATFRDLDFVAYELIKPRLIPSKQMTFLQTKNIDLVRYRVEKDITNAMLSTLLEEWRKNYEYLIDGIIVMQDKMYQRKKKNPKHAFAFKMVLSDQTAEAKVVDVIWTPSKDGLLKPRVKITPITLGGTRIEFATGFNADFIEKNKIGVGAIIKMVRAGDVIPQILSVVKPAVKAKMPDVPYHWNATHVDILVDNKAENITVREKTIARFFQMLEVDALSMGNVKRLMKAGFNTVEKIIKMTKDDFLTVDGFKDKLATKIFTSLHDKLEKADVVVVMAASNFFGRGMGRRRLRAILDEYPEILEKDQSIEDMVQEVMKIKGFAKKTAERFAKNLAQFKKFAKDIGYNINIKKKIKNTGHVLYKKKIVITGFRDKPLQEAIVKAGGVIASSVSSSTFAVLVKDKDEDTGKAEQARQKGIPLMTPSEFTTKYL